MGKPKVTALADWNKQKTDAEVRGEHIALSGATGEPQSDPAHEVNRKAPAAMAVKQAEAKKRSDVTDEPTTYFKDPEDRKEAWKKSDDCPGDI